MKLIDLTGQRFGRLLVIRCVGRDPEGRAMWLCKCDCGNETVVHSRHLRTGATQSCGCLIKEAISTHGFSKERLYSVWCDMRARCLRPGEPSYAGYGARGIKICEEWNDYPNFRLWALNAGYDPGAAKGKCTLDRIDVDGDYCPDNCRWVSVEIQNNNKRSSHFLTVDGETHTLGEWAKMKGICYETLRERVQKGQPPFKRGGTRYA